MICLAPGEPPTGRASLAFPKGDFIVPAYVTGRRRLESEQHREGCDSPSVPGADIL
jgi:hypothetical protein